MTLRELRELVGRLSYRPGWAMQVEEFAEGFWTGPRVVITAMLADTYNPARMAEFRAYASLPPLDYLTEELALLAIGGALKEAEIHESREWFKLDGKIIDDPHAEQRAAVALPRLMGR